MECLDAPGTKIDRRSVIRPTRFDAMEIARNVVFTVQSFYMDLINSGPISRSLHIWKVKVPLCIKIFMWFVHKQVILTKDNLIKRQWVGSSRCCFCDHDETIQFIP